jgi:hypothetical protein
MGEAKRRKALDPNYGKPKIKCFLGKAEYSDCHAIYLRLPSDDEARIVSVHKDIKVAYDIMNKCNDILDKMIMPAHKDPDIIFTDFIRQLIDIHGDYESDDAEFISSINGVTPIKPPIIKKYIVISASSEQIAKMTAGNIDENNRIGTSENHFDEYDIFYLVAKVKTLENKLSAEDIAKNTLASLSDGMPYHIPSLPNREIDTLLTTVFSSYVTAAYIADYMDANNLEPEVGSKLLERLWEESNKMQGKL